MDITRRSLLGASAVAGAGLLLPLRMPTSANAAVPFGVTPFTEAMGVATFTEKLPTLKSMGVIDATWGRSATITMVNAEHEFSAGVLTPTFAYQHKDDGQTVLGPVIIARRNVPFTLKVVNKLGVHPVANAIDPMIMGTEGTDATAPRAIVHLHGGNTSAASDGDPLDWYRPGQSFTHSYENTQEAACLWYHDHALGITRLNVLAGLAGVYLIRDANDPGDGRRLPAPPYEVPLLFQDRSFNPDGSLLYPLNDEPQSPPGPQKWIPEFFGDTATVNGKIQPNLNVKRGKYRFRAVNGSNARFYNVRFMSGGNALTFFQIGTDGGLLDRPVSLRSLLLAPGERADLIVDFASLPAGSKVILTNDALAPYPNGTGETVEDAALALPTIMQFTVTSARGWTTPLTKRTDLRSRTAPITRLDHVKVDKTRNMSLVEVMGPDGPTMVLMNNQTFHHSLMDPHLVKSNSIEEWVLINTTVDAHPMHLHFTQFQVLNRQRFDSDAYSLAAGYVDANGSTGPGKGILPPPAVDPYLVAGSMYPPEPNEQGWKDTVVVLPGEVTRIRIPFGPKAVPNTWRRGGYLPMAIGAAHTGKYVSHCHILEHEENDMMMRFKIVR